MQPLLYPELALKKILSGHTIVLQVRGHKGDFYYGTINNECKERMSVKLGFFLVIDRNVFEMTEKN